MKLPRINPTSTAAWKALEAHFQTRQADRISDLFAQNPNRVAQYTAQWNGFTLDYSKNRIDDTAKKLLLELAQQCQLKEAMQGYFGGSPINETESRAVMHTALRAPASADSKVEGSSVAAEVEAVKTQIKNFCDQIISGQKKGFTGKAFTDVVNIGIGGSDLGPVMAVEALKYYQNHLKIHFVSNVDGDHVYETLKGLNPETTLFVVVSKTFTTQETLSNALTVKKWFLSHASQKDIALHFSAVSTNTAKIAEFGIAPEHVFPMWDWVGGRFSLWSAVGLTIALSVGYNHFEAFLQGAHEMDRHFAETPFEDNIPVIMALVSIWYNNFYGAESEAIIPYTQYLSRFSAYLQQGIMESNGKYIDRSGTRVNYQTGTLIWGEPGTNSQHAFFQLMHQGTKLIPTDFIGFKKPLHGDMDHHDKLMSNFFAQTEALFVGKSKAEVEAEFIAKGVDLDSVAHIIPFKVFEGNKPTNTLLIDQLTPATLGSLIAAYEHKIFVQGVLWNIFSYDQWGVELGKQLANSILSDIDGSTNHPHDASTQALLKAYQNK
jgi:glucose-6-phosphate isomerase